MDKILLLLLLLLLCIVKCQLYYDVFRVANTVDAVTKIDFKWPGHNGSSSGPEVVNPGHAINCSANGRPTPTYTW